MLTVDNVYYLHALKFIYLWHKGLLPEVFNAVFQYVSNIHRYATRHAAKQNPYKFGVRTNKGKKKSLSFTATDIWKDLSSSIKNSSTFAFPKLLKHYLMCEQDK